MRFRLNVLTICVQPVTSSPHPLKLVSCSSNKPFAMGPNSGGGKRNKDNNNPAIGGARNRFSKWKPPTKDLKDKFSKQHDKRVNEHEVVAPSNNNKPQSTVSIAGSVKASGQKLGQQPLMTSTGEMITIHANVVNELLRIFQVESSTQPSHLSLPKESSSAKQAASVPPEKEIMVHHLSSKPTPVATIKSVATPAKTQSDALETRQVHNLLTKYGFDTADTSDLLKSASATQEENLLVMQTLAKLSQQPSFNPTPLSSQKNEPPVDLSLNEDLMGELEVLSSIYMEHVTYRGCVLGGLPSCIVDVSIPLEADIIQSAKKQPTSHGAKRDEQHYVRVRVFIPAVAAYPRATSLLLGWILPSDFDSDKPTSGKGGKPNVKTGTTALLPNSVARDLSIQAMAHIHAYQIQCEAPAVFEFLQHIRENLAPALAAHYLAHPSNILGTSIEAKETPGLSENKNAFHKKTPKGGNKPAVVELPAPEVTGPPPMPPRPTTTYMQSIEYRTALSSAFSASLVGDAARAKAHAELEYLLPKSTLDAIKVEEAYHEETLNRAHSVTDLSTKMVIDCTRLLVEGLQVNKAKAKALVMDARQAMLSRKEYFARTEDQLRTKLVTGGVAIFRERLDRKDSKREDKRKTPVMTLRDAFELRKLRERAANGDTEDDNGGLDEGSAKSMAGMSLQDSAGALKPPTPPVEEESPEDEEGIEEETLPEPEPEDPAKIQAALEAAREKKRLQDIESRRMRSKQLEKQSQPKYQEMMARRATLPAYQMKDTILEAIDKHSVVVISGDTGCGKTTQVPQLVLDDLIEKGRGGECSIIVTQPRRISAISVSERIAKERVETVGQSTGYHIRLEVKKGPATKLLLMTTGVLLRMLQVEGNLEGVSHIFVDEVHERDINTDFLLIILKKLLKQRPDLKVILMSATLNANLFLDYFRIDASGAGAGKAGGRRAPHVPRAMTGFACTLLSIPGRTFPVTNYFLEDAFQATNFEFPANSPCLANAKGKDRNAKKTGASGLDDKAAKRLFLDTLRKSKHYSEKTLTNIDVVDESVINTDLILKLVLHIIATTSAGVQKGRGNGAAKGGDAGTAAPMDGEAEGAILIFVPGLANIQDVVESLKACPQLTSRTANVKIFPLHSSLSSQEQNQVFQPVPAGWRKIVVSTNIAETSVTIEDVVYVIDTCRVKENSYDEVSQMNVLEEMWTSKANCRQRKGRAGRVRSGVCYHLVSKFTMDRLPDYMVPEMLKMSLDDLILQVLALDLGDPYTFLRSAISPPEDVAVTNALLFLESLSAVVVNNFDTTRNLAGKDITVDLESEITPLGYHLAALPINPRIGKLILYGVQLHCIDPILTIASAVSVKSVFVSPFGDKENADEAKLRYLDGNSDLLTFANAVSTWKSLYGKDGTSRKRVGAGFDSAMSENEYCRKNYLNLHSLKMIDQMRGQFLSLLKDIGFMPGAVNLDNVARCAQNVNGGHVGLIKSAICAGLSPNILLAGGLRDKNAGKRLSEISLQSRIAGNMKVHPSSVMSDAKYLDSPYLVYLEAMKTTQVYVRDVTTVPPLVLALFSGRSKVNTLNGAVTVDGWLQFRTPSLRVAQCLLRVRDALEDAFMQKVLDPSSETTTEWEAVLKCIHTAVSAI